MAWYDTRQCELCEKTIGRRFFWQAKPRLVGRDRDVRDAAYVTDSDSEALLKRYRLVCADCYFNRYGDVERLAPKSGAMDS
jgi:hypothetical protein